MANPPDNTSLPHPILLLVNGNSRRGQEMFGPAIALLRENGLNIGESCLAKNRAETKRLLEREVAAGHKLVIAGGGDGTLSTCAEYLAGTEVAMGVLPLGTGNTFARSIGLPVDLKGAIETIAAGRVESIDVGKCNQQVFLNSVGLGFTSELAGALNHEIKRKLGLLAWPVIGARIAFTHRPIRLRITTAERTYTLRTHQFLVANGRYVAGPIIASNEASVQDNALTVLGLGGASKGDLLIATLDWLRHKQRESPRTEFFETKKLKIESLGRRVKASVDGEINEKTPLELSVWPRALKVVVPRDFVADNV